MGDFDVTVTGLRELEATFGRIRVGTLPAVDAVVRQSTMTVKRGAQRRVSGLAHAPAYPSSITDDIFHTPFSVRSEIGPDKNRRQGALGNLIAFGSLNNAPIPHLFPDLDAEAPHFERALAEAAGAMWRRA